jgi:hypothetical protein
MGEELPSDLVWHYTTFKGLEGIVAGKLRASHAAYLNDTLEFTYGLGVAFRLIREHIRRCRDQESPCDAQPPISKSVEKLRTCIERRFRGMNDRDVFVCSFSESEDHLGQWRAYGPAGPAFAVGFDAVRLKQVAAISNFSFCKVHYGEASIEEEVRRALAPAFSSMRDGVKSELSHDDIVDLAAVVAVNIRDIAIRTKHDGFREEVEWRLVRSKAFLAGRRDLPVKFRSSGSLVVPYVEIPLHTALSEESFAAEFSDRAVETPIVAVSVGPSPHPRELKYAIEQMVRRKGLSKVDVRLSELPFRDW